MIESEANSMMVSTDKWLLSQEERAALKAANRRLVEEKNSLLGMLNRWQGIIGTARGNVAKAEKEMQEFLRSVL